MSPPKLETLQIYLDVGIKWFLFNQILLSYMFKGEIAFDAVEIRYYGQILNLLGLKLVSFII